MDQFEAFCLYNSLKLHFSSSYDYTKYNGKLKSNTIENYEKLKSAKFIFQKLSKQKDLKNFLISNFLVDNYHYSQLRRMECVNNFISWQERTQSLSYKFKEEIGNLHEDFQFNFKPRENQYPIVIEKYLKKKISLETLIILLDITKSIKYFNNILEEDVIWQNISNKIAKYKPFFEYDIEKFGKITFQHFKEKEIA